MIAELSVWTGIPPDQIGADADIIALGLQSVEAVLMCGALETRLGVTLDPVLVFQHDRVSELAKADHALLIAK